MFESLNISVDLIIYLLIPLLAGNIDVYRNISLFFETFLYKLQFHYL